MRVTHVITRLVVGGAQENTIASVLGLRQKSGLELHLISGPQAGPEGSLQSSFNAHPELLTIIPELVREINPWKDWAALHRLTDFFRKQAPKIVHTHSGKAGVLGRLAAAKAGVPIIIHSIHGPSFGAFQNPLSNLLFKTAERRAARITTHFIVVAEAMKQQYLAAGIGRPEQFTKIFSGFELSPFLTAQNSSSLRARFGLTDDDIVVGKIARLFKLKGHDDLFSIAPKLVAQNPRLKYLLVGGGEWRSRFEQLARDTGLQKHFIFTGLVPPSEVPSVVGVMDMVVHLSLREGLPRALPQALAAGKPVIAYDCDGAREVCRDGETGFLIRPHDKEGLTRRMLELASNAPLRNRLGETGREFVRNHFSVERLVEEQHQLYLRLARC